MTARGKLAVVIPSWDSERASRLVWDLYHTAATNPPEFRRTNSTDVIVVGTSAPDVFAFSPSVVKWFSPSVVKWIVPEHRLSPVEAMALGAEHVSDSSTVIAFLHDDMTISQQGWDTAILDHFRTHPRCGLIGFGGGTGFSDSDIYKLPYDYRQLARHDFVSNMRDAHLHGRRVTEPMRVAALDGFALVVSREFYTTTHPSSGGIRSAEGQWAMCLRDGIPFHLYDGWISCRAAELGYETWMLPIECHHEGGKTSVQMAAEYAEVVARLGYESPEDLYAKAHHVIYDRFSRILPIRVPQGDFQCP